MRKENLFITFLKWLFKKEWHILRVNINNRSIDYEMERNRKLKEELAATEALKLLGYRLEWKSSFREFKSEEDYRYPDPPDSSSGWVLVKLTKKRGYGN